MFILENLVYVQVFIQVILIILIAIVSRSLVHNLLVLFRANSVEIESKLKHSLFTVSSFDTSELKSHNTYTNLVNEKIKYIPFQFSTLVALIFLFLLVG